MKKLLVLICLMAVFVCVCKSVESAPPPQVYTKPSPILPSTLDPQTMEDAYSFHIANQIFDTIFKFDQFLDLKPNLAESFKLSEDGKLIAITLRKNVKFHNGKILNANDVIFTLQRMIKYVSSRYPELLFISGSKDYLDNKKTSISGLNKISDTLITITLTKASPTLLMVLATPNASILSSNANGDFSKNPIGTGPFKVKSFEAGKSVVLEPNLDYFDFVPKLEKLLYVYASEEDAINGFNKGHFQDLQWYNPKINQLKISYSVIQAPIPETGLLILNTRKPPFNSRSAREAFALSLNKKSLTENCFTNRSEPRGFIPFGIGGHDRSYIEPDLDLSKAHKLLMSSKNKTPVSIKALWINHHPCSNQFNNLVKQNLEKTGFEISTSLTTPNDFPLNSQKTKTYDILEARFFADYPDAISMLNYFKSDYQYNVSGFASKEYDIILRKALENTNKYERYDLYQSAQKLLKDDFIIINLYHSIESAVYQNNVRGIKTTAIPITTAPMNTVYLENDQ